MIYIGEEMKKAWVSALRSGKYRQGNGFLCRTDSYCCLGVLADLLAEKGEGSWDIGEPGARLKTYNTTGFSSGSFLPGTVVAPATQSQLSHMNDSGHKTFADIADYIEERL